MNGYRETQQSYDTVLARYTNLNEVYRVLKEGSYALTYDLVSDTPSSVLKEGARQFGRLRMILLWLHAFEEPFYSAENYRLLSKPTRFGEGQIRFVGVLSCLVLKKPPMNEIFQ